MFTLVWTVHTTIFSCPSITMSNAADILSWMAPQVHASCFGMCNPVIGTTTNKFQWKDILMSHKWGRCWAQSNTFEIWGTPGLISLKSTERAVTELGWPRYCRSNFRYSGGPPSACKNGRWMERGCDCWVFFDSLYTEMQSDWIWECPCKKVRRVLTKHWGSISRWRRRGKSKDRSSLSHMVADRPTSCKISSLSGELWRIVRVKESRGGEKTLLQADENDLNWVGVARKDLGNDVTRGAEGLEWAEYDNDWHPDALILARRVAVAASDDQSKINRRLVCWCTGVTQRISLELGGGYPWC